MTQRIAPNNSLPATHFIEVWGDSLNKIKFIFDNPMIEKIDLLQEELQYTSECLGLYTIAIFRIRENKLPTIHNFNK